MSSLEYFASLDGAKEAVYLVMAIGTFFCGVVLARILYGVR